MRAFRIALIVLSLSPIVVTATWLAGMFVLNSPWPALTVALVRQDRAAPSVWGACIVQGVGVLLLVVLLVLIWTGSGRGGEAGMEMALLTILAAIPTVAVTLLGAGMLSFVLWGMVGSLE